MNPSEVSENEISPLHAKNDLPDQLETPIQNELPVVQEGSVWVNIYRKFFGTKNDY